MWIIRSALALAVLSTTGVTSVYSQRAGSLQVRWLGHAAFEIVSPGGTRILIDPFITGNPATPESLRSLTRFGGAAKPAAILVSHSHSDHALDARAIAQASGALVISAYEYASSLGLPDAQVKGGNVGGAFRVGDVTVHLVPAMHSSEPGRPLGFVLEFSDGRTLYHTGDTWIFGDMALVQELYHPAIILLGVGGGPYTEDPRTAALAVRRYFKPTVIVPMHYGTFPGLATEAEVRTAFAGDTRLQVMHPGETRRF
ncbi:MAG: metal-dependent hydrolase [Gemmatimonadales bacterium]|nr:metal-dependent hydrolase [Gemmatimonadales bacterium]